MHCEVRSADRTFFDGEATIVVARSTRGEFAVMDDHAPMLAAIGRGPLRVKTSETERVFACFGGSLRVSPGAEVTVLVEDAVPLEEIDLALGESAQGSTPAETDEGVDARRDLLHRIKETYA